MVHGFYRWATRYTALPFRKIVFVLAESVVSDEAPRFVVFHIGLHCLLEYVFTM